MTIATYSELLTEIDAWMDRSDLSARIPTFLRLFEARINRRLNDPDMEGVSTTNTESGEAEYALPDDLGSMRYLFLSTDPKTQLYYMTPAALRDTYSENDTGQPAVYTVENGALVLAPTPDGEYTINLAYNQHVPALTDTNTTNWLLDLAPDLYLWGTLTRAEAFLKDDDRVAVWKSAEDEALAELIRYGNRRRLGAGPLQLRPTVIE
jgi:hypothetical protein